MDCSDSASPSLAFLRKPIFLIPYLLSCGLVLLLPDNALDRWAAVRACVEFIGQYVPIIENYTRKSAFPQVTATYFSVVVATVPGIFWAALSTPRVLVDAEKMKRLYTRFGIFYLLSGWGLLVLVLLVAYLLVAYFLVAVNPGYDLNVMPINRSKVALAIFGQVFAGGGAAILVAFSFRFGQTLLNLSR